MCLRCLAKVEKQNKTPSFWGKAPRLKKHILLQGWSQQSQAFPDGGAAAAAFSAFAAAAPSHSGGFLDPWASAPRLASLATPGSQIWQSQPLPGTALPTSTWQSPLGAAFSLTTQKPDVAYFPLCVIVLVLSLKQSIRDLAACCSWG